MKTQKTRITIYLTTIFVIASLGLSVGSASADDIICREANAHPISGSIAGCWLNRSI
jgi:preprotein translocase subunit SecG